MESTPKAVPLLIIRLDGKSPVAPQVLFFDDEPVEQVIYGGRREGPTPAHLYRDSLQQVDQIMTALVREQTRQAIDLAALFGAGDQPVSKGACFILCHVMRQLVPHCPNPAMAFNLCELGPLVEKLWDAAVKSGDDCLQTGAGPPVYRWYEHQGRYEKARRVLERLVEIYYQNSDLFQEAIMTNNLAFEFFLERRYNEALPLFEKAEKIFRQDDEAYQAANCRANYWQCRYMLSGAGPLAAAEDEIKEISNILMGDCSWHTRKSLILLARIEEYKGNINKAISLVEKAINACKDGVTRYPETDKKYLRRLERAARGA